jgi:glycosyltransferase involved in cell wall biosynthesis
MMVDPMPRILVFASDILPLDRLPTSGGGLRSWQIIKGLESHGLEVEYRMPRERFLCSQVDTETLNQFNEILWSPSSQSEILAQTNPDIVIFANAEQNHLPEHPGIPVVVDLHGPRLVEVLMSSVSTPGIDRSLFISQKLSKLGQADFITCAGERQRFYFLAFLLAAGYPMEEANPAVVPVAMSPQLPRVEKDLDQPRLVYAGGFYPWQKNQNQLKMLPHILEADARGILEVFGGSHQVDPEHEIQVNLLREALKKSPQVRWRGYLPRASLLESYQSAYAAFELMEKNLERELAFTTRTIEFLWAGLPVIYNDYAELSPIIEAKQAGWCVDPSDLAKVESVVRMMLADPEMVLTYSRNAQELVRERFTWDKTIAPLADFCKNPQMRTRPKLYFRLSPHRKPEISFWEQVLTVWQASSIGEFGKLSLGKIAKIMGLRRSKDGKGPEPSL